MLPAPSQVIGFLLLFVGVVWLCWDAASMRPITRAVVVAHYERLPKDQTAFSREETQRYMREVAFGALERYPMFIIPAVITFVGGAILGSFRQPPPRQ